MDENYTQTPSVFAVGESSVTRPSLFVALRHFSHTVGESSLKDGGEAWLPS